MTKPNHLDDIKIHVKFKLSALWTAVMFCYVYGDYFSFYVPHKLEKFIAGDTLLDSPTKLFAASILMAVPSLMIFLSLVLKPAVNRWLNILLGIFFTAIMVLIAVTSISPWWTFYVFLAFLESLLTLVIIWCAWTWPRNQESN
jgi:hypothetical protein